MIKYALFCFVWAVMALPSLGQDSTKAHKTFIGKSLHAIAHVFDKEGYGKNIIRYNPTPSLLFWDIRNAAIGYERVVGKNQSFSFNIGPLFLPDFLGESKTFTNLHALNETGIITSLDYRFYIKKLNTRPAPNGIYIGPYYSLNYHKGKMEFVYQDESGTSPVQYSATLDNMFMLHNVGFEIGYQFILFKRLTLDMVFLGPSISFYKVEFQFNSQLSFEKEHEFYQQYSDAFFNRFPILEEIHDKGSFEKQGAYSGIRSNFRYLIQVGYHF